jgi:hypothetical protein
VLWERGLGLHKRDEDLIVALGKVLGLHKANENPFGDIARRKRSSSVREKDRALF